MHCMRTLLFCDGVCLKSLISALAGNNIKVLLSNSRTYTSKPIFCKVTNGVRVSKQYKYHNFVSDCAPCFEALWPHGQYAQLRIEQTGFKTWLSTLRVLKQDTLLSQCLSPPRCINGEPANLMLGVTLRWTSIPSRGE